MCESETEHGMVLCWKQQQFLHWIEAYCKTKKEGAQEEARIGQLLGEIN